MDSDTRVREVMLLIVKDLLSPRQSSHVAFRAAERKYWPKTRSLGYWDSGQKPSRALGRAQREAHVLQRTERSALI